MFLFCLVFAMSLCASVYMCFVVTCRERADILARVWGVYYEFVTFPIGVLGRVWCLIVSIPDLCTLTYFEIVNICRHTARFDFKKFRVLEILNFHPWYYQVTPGYNKALPQS